MLRPRKNCAQPPMFQAVPAYMRRSVPHGSPHMAGKSRTKTATARKAHIAAAFSSGQTRSRSASFRARSRASKIRKAIASANGGEANLVAKANPAARPENTT